MAKRKRFTVKQKASRQKEKTHGKKKKTRGKIEKGLGVGRVSRSTPWEKIVKRGMIGLLDSYPMFS